MKLNNRTMLPKPTKHKEENNIAKPNKGVKHSTTSMNYVIMVYNLDFNIFFYKFLIKILVEKLTLQSMHK